MRSILLLIPLLIIYSFCSSQDKKCDISDPIDIPQTGWNKLIQVDGNTLLFHFEHKKGIQVKTFDKAHKEIGSENYVGGNIDLKDLEHSFFDGLIGINGEAVLFITQQSGENESLFRLRFDAQTGKLISEDNISKLSGFRKNTTAFVLKELSEDKYYIIAFSKGSIEEANIQLYAYDKEHHPLNQVPLGMVKKGYDNIHLLSQEIDKSGSILITAELDKIIQYPDVIEKYIVLYYLPKDGNAFSAQILKMPQGTKDFNIKFTENTYAGTINVFLSSLLQQNNKSESQPSIFFYQLMLITDKEMNVLHQVELKNNKVSEFLRAQTGKQPVYAGNVLAVNANNKGNTIVISEDLLSKTENDGSNAAHIGITEYDHEGNERWGIVIPKTISNNPGYTYSDAEVFKAGTNAYELSHILCLNDKNDYYILYNDLPVNFDKKTGASFNPVTDYDKTNTISYHLDKKKEISKSYLFAPITGNEYKHIYTHSGSFDKGKNTYAILLSRTTDDGKTLAHIAWCRLGN